MKRHDDVNTRMTRNIKKNRAAVSDEEVKRFFTNTCITKELEGVPDTNIWNYDETNLADDTGSKKAIVKRGSKYPERIMDTTKTSISLMFCGNATGRCLPPYVVYKADHLWSTWCEGGPEGARYNRSKSGWFDSICFED